MPNKYVFKLRRGTKYVDEKGETLKQDGAVVRDDWTDYTAKEGHIDPLESELVIEYEVYPDGKKIPRLKIGDGVSTFAELEYISVDSFILPKPVSVTLYADKWEQVVDDDGEYIVDTYSQAVEVENAIITPNSKVDLQPTTADLCRLYDWGVALNTKNTDGNITVYAVGGMPTSSISLQATVTEVLVEEVAEDE